MGLAIDVLSGGSTDYVQGEYRAGWSYKTGWLDGGTVWYDPNSGDTWDFERQVSQTPMSQRWGSESAALLTLNQDYYFVWCTQEFFTNHQFDDVW